MNIVTPTVDKNEGQQIPVIVPKAEPPKRCMGVSETVWLFLTLPLYKDQ